MLYTTKFLRIKSNFKIKQSNPDNAVHIQLVIDNIIKMSDITKISAKIK